MQEVRREDQGLYRREFEHDNCGIGAVVNIKGKKTHDTVANALRIVEHLEHRAGKDAEGKTGDGVGILLQISHKFFKKPVRKRALILVEKENMVLHSSFSHSMRSSVHRQRKCSRSLWKKKVWNFLAGELFR